MAADRAVLAVARRRHGVMTVGQLVEAGLSHDAVRHRVKQGWLRRRHRRTTIHPADARTKDGIPVTSPARTLLDLAATVQPLPQALPICSGAPND